MSEERYECEVRFIIEDVKVLRKKLHILGGRTIKEYKFTDHILKPSCGDGKEWLLDQRILRVREWHLPEQVSELIFTHTRITRMGGLSFKRTIYPRGKIVMHRGCHEEVMKLASDLEFQTWYSVVKRWGKLIELKRLGGEVVALEDVEGVGVVLEVEVWGEDVEAVSRRMLKIVEEIGLDLQKAMPEPLPVIVAERQGLI